MLREIETYTMLQTAKETQLQYSNNLEAYEGYLQNIWHDRVCYTRRIASRGNIAK